MALVLTSEQLDGTIAVDVDASDDGGVVNVMFFMDDDMFFNDEMIPYGAELDTSLFDEEPHGLRAVAYDIADQGRRPCCARWTA